MTRTMCQAKLFVPIATQLSALAALWVCGPGFAGGLHKAMAVFAFDLRVAVRAQAGQGMARP